MRSPGPCYFISKGTIVWRRWPRAIDLWSLIWTPRDTHKYTPIAFGLVSLLLWPSQRLFLGNSWGLQSRRKHYNRISRNWFYWFYISMMASWQKQNKFEESLWISTTKIRCWTRNYLDSWTGAAFTLHTFTISRQVAEAWAMSNQCQIGMLIES